MEVATWTPFFFRVSFWRFWGVFRWLKSESMRPSCCGRTRPGQINPGTSSEWPVGSRSTQVLVEPILSNFNHFGPMGIRSWAIVSGEEMCLLNARSFHCHLSFPQGRERTCCLLDVFYRFAKSQKMMRKRFHSGVKADDDTDSCIVFLQGNRKPISADESTMRKLLRSSVAMAIMAYKKPHCHVAFCLPRMVCDRSWLWRRLRFASGENPSLTDLPDTWPRFVSLKKSLFVCFGSVSQVV